MIARNITFYANGYSLAEALPSFSVQAEIEELDATVLANNFRSYEPGFKSGSLDASGIFDFDSATLDKIHNVLGEAFENNTDLIVTTSTTTVANGVDAIMLSACETAYDVNAPLGQLIMSEATMRAKEGINFGKWFIAEAVAASTETSASIDNGAATANGGVLHVQLYNDDASDVDTKIQHSTDDSNWVDLVAVNNLSATHTAGSATVAAGTTVARYLRAVSVITGGDTLFLGVAFARR